MKPNRTHTTAAALAFAAGLSSALAQPVTQTWSVMGPDDTVASAAAAVSGWYATADSFEDSVEIRDVKQSLVHTISRADIHALLPWMSLGGGPDGPSGLAFSDSGRLLFILVHDANTASDGQPSDAILRYDTASNSLVVFARLELFDRDDQWPHLAAAHFKGRLYIGTDGAGAAGSVRVYNAGADALTNTVLSTSALPAGTAVHGLAIDRLNNLIYAASESAIYRANTNTLPLAWTLVGSISTPSNIRGITYSDHYGSPGQVGLYAVTMAPGASSVLFIPQTQLLGAVSFAPATYATSKQEWHSIAATADGKLLVGADEDAVLIADAADARLSYQAWLSDEFQQVVAFGKGLISPSGEPAGWVIDGDVQSGARWEPATPDGAGWVVMLLIMNEQLTGDPQALPLARSILTRYAGLAPDGIKPSITADGIMRHWIEPATGNTKAGWDPEYATLSTMKIVLAASRARSRWRQDAGIQQAAGKIICQLKNHDAYFQTGSSDATYFKGLVGGGPDPNSRTTAFSEAILFTEQLGYYGGATATTKHSHWLNRSLWPTATYVSGRPITGNSSGNFLASFTSLYSLLVQPAFRISVDWQAQIINIRESAGAWTDDNGPKYNTIFSAGTTRSDWGGYNADSLSNHPGNVSTFTSLMALSGTGATASSVGAYNAYRHNARETFSTGASILYRRSDIDKTYTPPDAGLPDVALGALGLAELIQPGSLDAVLAIPYTPCCWVNCDNSATLPVFNANDFQCFLNKFASGDSYANCDGSTTIPTLNANDFQCFLNAFAAGCT